MHQQQTAFENIVGKGEIALNEQFLLFPRCFQLNQITVSPFVHIFDIIPLWLNWKSVKLAYQVHGKPFPKQALVFTCLQYKFFENTVGKGEIAHDEQFLLFPTVFSTCMEKFQILL